jgi:hypothetical protein
VNGKTIRRFSFRSHANRRIVALAQFTFQAMGIADRESPLDTDGLTIVLRRRGKAVTYDAYGRRPVHAAHVLVPRQV